LERVRKWLQGRLLAGRRPQNLLLSSTFADSAEANSLPYNKPQLDDNPKLKIFSFSREVFLFFRH
jgi:hypothetical protein